MTTEHISSMARMLRQIEDPSTRRMFETIMNNIDSLDIRINTLEHPADYQWFDLYMLAGWVEYDGAVWNKPQYTKTDDGIVMLRGLVKSGTTTSGTVMCYLPEGYRPELRNIFVVNCSTGSCRIDVAPSGAVVIISGANGYLSFDNLSFQAYR